MDKQSWLYKVTAWAVTIGLLLQSFPFWLGLSRPQPVLAESGGAGQTAVSPSSISDPTQPDALAHPISISRVQSTYQAGSSVVITYTVTNNQRPLNLPELASSATITETANRLATIDIDQDLNTVKNVVVTNQFLNETVILSASDVASFDGSRYLWNLGHIAPQQSRQLTVTLQLPASTNEFVDLDSGAAAHGSWRGRLVSHQAWPAVVVPDDLAQWLITTPDANLYDEQMLAQVGSLEQSPEALFTFVQAMGYEVYAGSLRGTRGSLWSQAGNSVDQSSLLIAMLRSSGIPARYRHGTLTTADAQSLILSMFPASYDTLGHIPADTPTSDPAHDPALLALVQEHWWVEAYLPGTGWTDLDPSFATAVPGQQMADTVAGDGTDRIAELPAALRHTVTLSVEVELYNSFPLGGPNLNRSVPLAATYNSVSLAGQPINLGYFVDTVSQGGLVYANYIHTYTPYFRLGQSDSYLAGDSFQEFFTNFPLATTVLTGVWLTIERNHPDGRTDGYTRELKDLIGVDNRQFGGTPELPPRGAEPLLGQGDVAQLQVIPHSRMPVTELNRLQADILSIAPGVAQAMLEIEQLSDEDQTQNLAYLYQHFETVEAGQMVMLEMMGATYQVVTTAPEYQLSEEAMLVKSYPQEPKLLLLSQQVVSDTLSTTFELLNIQEKALAYPGQTVAAAAGATLLRTMGAKEVEYRIMQQLAGENVSSPFATFNQAQADGVPMTLITNANLDELAQLPISSQAQARILQAVHYHNLTVIVPNQMIAMPRGETIAWLEYDADGNASYVAEDGLRAASEYGLKVTKVSMWVKKSAAYGGFVTTVTKFLGDFLKGYKPDPKDVYVDFGKPKSIYDNYKILYEAVAFGIKSCDKLKTMAAAADCYMGVSLAGTIIAAALGLYFVGTDPSLPEAHFALSPALQPPSTVTGTITIAPSHTAATIDVNATTGHLAVQGETTTAWQTTHTTGLVLETAAAANATLYDGDTLLDSGVLQVNERTQATLDGSVAIDLAGEGHLAFYAPATPGLAGGSQWSAYNAELDAPTPYTLALNDTVVEMNGMVYSGDLHAVIEGTAQVNGRFYSPLPHFQSETIINSQTANLTLGPLTGTLLAGSEPVEAANGLAVAGFSGPVALAEAEPTLDQVSFSGPADWFTLDLESSPASLNPTEELVITPVIQANFEDTYTLTVDLPLGWAAAVSDGQIVATPPADATVGQHLILVSAQSGQHPDLVVSALVEAEITPYSGVSLSITPDPLLTIPMGDVLDPEAVVGGHAGHLPNGQAEIPDAAYVVTLKNESTTGHTFDLTVTGLPAGWTLMSGVGQTEAATLVLGPGQQRHLGLYVSPTGPGLLAAGTSYPIEVTAVAQTDPTLSDADSALFTMPGLAFPYLNLTPPVQWVGETAVTNLTLTTHNVGNTAGTFPVTVTVRSSQYSSAVVAPTPLISPTTFTTPPVAAGAAVTATIALTTTGLTRGQTYFVIAESAQGEYKPAALAAFTLVSPVLQQLYEAAASCNLGEANLTAALESLALAAHNLESSCESGQCALSQRDQVVAAAESVATYSRLASPLVQTHTDLEAVAAALSTYTSDGDILAALPALATAVTNLNAELCLIEQHRSTLRLTPWLDAALPGQPVNYDLQLSNRGTLTTTYAVTVTLPHETHTFTQTLLPGTTLTTAVPVSTTQLGLHTIQAAAAARTVDNESLPTAVDQAMLNVVDRFVQVVEVAANPPFVETGVSTTTLQAEIANVAGLRQAAVAQAAVIAPGGQVRWSDEIPVTILTGSPRLYYLGQVETSGWSQGVYTITLNLVDESSTPIPGGSGHGYLIVGQGLHLSHSVTPRLVPPGTVTVTSAITTEVLSQQATVSSEQITVSSFDDVTARDLSHYPVATDNDEAELTIDNDQLSDVGEAADEPDTPPTDEELSVDYGRSVNDEALSVDDQGGMAHEETDDPDRMLTTEDSQLTSSHSFVRYEQDAFTFDDSWSTVNQAWTSGGQTARSAIAGSSASFTFDGTWVGIGFSTNTAAGHAEIFLNGESQGIVDTYSRYNDVTAVYFDNLISGTHTISVTVTGERNPFATNHRVEIDYVDVWDGTPLPDGSFEENDERVYLSNGWVTAGDGAASGGEYIRGQWPSTHTNAWFHFTGDSITFQALAYNGAGLTKITIDGELMGVFDLYSATTMTRTFSFDNLGAGAHVLQLRSYRGRATVDRFVTPGEPPFHEPPVPVGFTRYEEDHPDLRYNGVPWEQTATSWNMASYGWSSSGYGMWTNTVSDTVSLTFDGEWVSVGLITRNTAGLAEIFIDGVSQGIVDTYSRYDDVLTLSYDLTPGTHTITVTVLGESNDFSNQQYVRFDYIDVWDGTAVPDGSVEENDERIYLSPGWATASDSAASGGQYIRSQWAGTHTNAWFNFTGDSVSFQALAYDGAGMTRIAIDGEVIGVFDLYSPTTMTRTFSFDNLGPGAHVLELRDYRGRATVDRFVTPGAAPFYEPPVREGIVRYEEDDPAILYNGVPWEQAPTSWNMATYNWSSGGYGMWSGTAGDTISFTFEGEWVSLGLITRNTAGLAEIFIDGESQGIVDTYTRDNDLLTLTYDLTPGIHTITVTVLGQTGAFNNQRYVRLDYIDVWDGTAVPDGSVEENDERVYLGGNWTVLNNGAASDGRYIRSTSGHAWFHFMGDSVSYQAIAYGSGGKARLHVDGRYLDTVDLSSGTLITRTFSYEGFGPGPHVLQVSAYRGNTTVDAFIAPGQAPFIDPTYLPPGIVRYEEDHPSILYNGAPYTRTTTTWIREDSGFSARASDAQYIRSGAAGNTISFDFSGGWLGIGFVTTNVAGQAEIAVDDDVLEIVDLYTPGNGMLSRYYDGLGEGAHTLTITVLGTKHPDSGDTRVYLDYIDVWDGQPMPDGAFEEWDERIHYSNGWTSIAEGAASGGEYVRSQFASTYTNAWFPFTGDSVTYQAVAYSGAGQVDVLLDGNYIGTYDLYNSTVVTRTFSFGNLGDGPHVLQLEHNTGRVTLDRFDQPGTVPFIPHYQVDINPATAFPGGRPGGTAVQTINLHNQGIQPDTYDLTISGAAWATEVISTVHLSPTEIRPIQITTAVPAGTPLGASDSFTVTAVSQTDGSVMTAKTLNTYAVTVDAQLCIAMDGSGSISASEFELMVGGLAAAMRDSTAVPRNATIEFSIIQFAGSTRTEIAPVVIVNEDAAEWVAQQIEQIAQINGGTPMEDAIDLCTNLLTTSPHTTHALRRVINMVTDGEPNRPADTITARNNAIAAGVDYINAEAIGVTESAIAFLRDELVYPQPGYEAPPFISGQGGFVIRADTFEEFVESIGQKVGFALDTGYTIELDHHVPVTAVTLLTDTITPPPEAITGTTTADTLHWTYSLIGEDNTRSHTLQTVLPDMQPGETRAVSLGTGVYYRLSGGENWLSLPPLYVTAAHILEIAPDEQMIGLGNTAVYTLTLHNPGPTADVYDLDVLGLPAGWADYPAAVNVPAQSSVEVPLAVTAPVATEPADRPFLVTATTGSGGEDMATASLTLFNGLEIALNPPEQTAPTGTAVTYTLTLTNYQLSTVNYQLSTDGLALVDLPDEVEIGGETAVSIPVIVSSDTHGPLPFSVTAEAPGGQDTATAVLNAVGHYAVGLALDPEDNVAGPVTPALFDLTVSNLGDTADGYNLTLNLPTGWSGALDASGTPVEIINLPPHIFNSANLRLLIVPDVATVPGDYEFSVTATSQSGPGVQATITGTVEVLPLGVQVAIEPQQTTMSPLDDGLWQVTITNTGSLAGSFDLTAAGIISLTAGFSSSSVTLNPGQSQTVQLSSDPLPFALPQSYPFWVMATSQSDERIRNAAEASVTFTGYEDVEVAWLPAGQTVTDTLSATFMLVMTNTGNIPTTYQLDLEMPGLSGQLLFDQLSIPAHATAVLPLTVYAGGPGTYTLTGTAVSDQGTSDSDTATLTIAFSNQPPIVAAGPDQTVVVNSLVQFNGSASDPDDDPLTVAWEFGDGNGATGSLTPSHVYEEIGTYTVILTVSDTAGHVVSDTLQVTVVAEEIFEIDAGSDRETNEGSPLTFSGTITDTAGTDPYTILWDFGDGHTAAGSLTPSHTYADNGTYTVTLTVTNSEDQVATGTLEVTVHNVPPTVTAVDDQTIHLDETVSGILATFTDPGVLDTHTAVIDWGDGTVTTGLVHQVDQTVSGAHTYALPGVHTVTITVTDNDGDEGSDSLQVTVIPAAIFVVAAGSDMEGDEGSALTFNGVITDTAGTDPYTILWDFGDGHTAAGSLTPNHTYADNGVYTVTLTVTNSEDQVATGTLEVTVHNVPPTVTAVDDQTIHLGETVSGILATFTDPGILDTHTAVIDWGDGTVTTGLVDQVDQTVSGTHSYTAAGVYTVTVTVTDNDGGQSSDSLLITVQPRILYLPLIVNNNG